MPIMGVAKFKRFFLVAASLDVDKADLKRTATSSITRSMTCCSAARLRQRPTIG